MGCASASSTSTSQRAPSAASDPDRAPAFRLPSLTTPGDASLPSGKVSIVFFWATWNAPCKRALPKLEELYEKYSPNGLAIVAVSVDDEGDGVAEAAKEWGARFPVAWDRGHSVANAWQPSRMPTLFVVDKSGAIVGEHYGWRDGAESDVERDVKRLLSPPTAAQIERARALRAEAKSLADRGDRATAIERLRESMRLAFDPETLYDLGRNLELSGRRRDAAQVYLELLQTRMSHTDRASLEVRVQALLAPEP